MERRVRDTMYSISVLARLVGSAPRAWVFALAFNARSRALRTGIGGQLVDCHYTGEASRDKVVRTL